LIVPTTRIFGLNPSKALGATFSILLFFAALIFCNRYAKSVRNSVNNIRKTT